MGMNVGEGVQAPVDNWDNSTHSDFENATAYTVKWVLSRMLGPLELAEFAKAVPYWWGN